MNSDSPIEHFVTLFDSTFLPMGMALHGSLMAHGQPFHLWIICMDELAEEQLARISLPHVTLLPLADVETPELLAVKMGRNRAEYCWTVTPFSFTAVFDRDAGVERVTYLDADLFFFASPRILLRELEESSKDVLITEHAYAPEYEKSIPRNGRFCVQFLTFCRTAGASRVLKWWQERCVEWCFDRLEEGKFGDQMYLDQWPELFGDAVHIVRQTEKTLAPWNVRHFAKRQDSRLDPVFYHFHGFRLVGQDKVRLYHGYSVDGAGLAYYEKYTGRIAESIRIIRDCGYHAIIQMDSMPWFRRLKFLLCSRIRYMKL